ncbi:MAG: transcription-repair coupling factor [Candidatus Cloacimonetes bacterium]|nr:transcription-repair coupling factor [Candidatus Cloacimonadota bacterium]
MLYSSLKTHLDASAFVRQFREIITSDASGVLFFKLNRSVKALLAVEALKLTNRDVVLISADETTAEDYFDDLHLVADSGSACFLPDFEVLPYEERSPHYTLRAQRIATLATTFSNKPAVYSLSVRSFLRKINSPKLFSSTIIDITRNSEYDPDKLISDLVGMGYQNEFQVGKVGDVARRGGIIDIYAPNMKYPIRIEFFGDEIDSLRRFYITSQRSFGDEISTVRIIPSREFSMHDIDTSEEMWEKVHRDGFYEGIEQDMSLLLPQTALFYEYLNNPIIICDEYQYFSSYFKELADETGKLWVKAREKNKSALLPSPDDLFAGKELFAKLRKNQRVIYFGQSFYEGGEIAYTVEAPLQSQTNMHSDLTMLEQSLKEKIEAGFKIIIQSDNRNQSKRMQELLSDWAEHLQFNIGVLHQGFNLLDAKLAVFTDHEIFSRYKRRKTHSRFSRDEALVDYESLKPGDYVVHIDYGIGVYEGLRRMMVEGVEIECLSLRYAEDDRVYIPTFQLSMVSRFVSDEGFKPTVHKLGGKRWDQQKRTARKQIETVAQDIVDLYAERKIRKGIRFDSDTLWQTEMEGAFIYEDTPDQTRSTLEIKEDMESDTSMERLLCGDVGFGKTEVAIRVAFKAVLSGYQVAILVPTTLLAEQHYFSFKERLAQYPINIAMFSRFRTPSQIRRELVRVASGDVDIAIGTHRLLSKDFKFKRLGLLIVDEEHRFGVRHKDKIRKMKTNVDTLYMSATPIPRTLSMALSRLKEISLIQTSPKARLPVRTVIVPWDEEVIKDAILREVDRGGQIFFVHNRVQTIDSIAMMLRKLLPRVTFQVAHGQMPEKQLEAVMIDFSEHQFDVLVTTTIIESGIDIPNANTLLIDRADMFGLAQLYQLRGRVGRSNRRAYAYMMIPPRLTDIARKRLETLTEYDYLGAGYQIAMRDLEIRGAGTLLGTRQSGVINSVGFNYYNQLLQQAVENVEQNLTADLWEEVKPNKEKRLRLATDYYFPEDYIPDEKTRFTLYKRMLEFKKQEQFDDLQLELKDRFGKVPLPALEALRFYRMRLLSSESILSTFQIRGGTIRLEFDNKSLPSRDKLYQMVGEFDYPVTFDTVGKLIVNFTIDKNTPPDREAVSKAASEILEYIHGWNKKK